jgi:large subunit ribosomal protein L3
MQGLIGRKVGMTRIFDADGRQVPVTVLEVGPCVVVQRKTADNDGYDAYQLGFETAKEARTNQPAAGRFKAAGVAPQRFLREFPAEKGDAYKVGDTITAAIFEGVAFVDLVGITKGRGFQGVMRRHHMSGGPVTHGGHSKRRIGSVGCRSFPGRIHKNKRMPGHMGVARVTQQNLKVARVVSADNLLLVQGAVPGPAGGMVIVKRALKKAAQAASK